MSTFGASPVTPSTKLRSLPLRETNKLISILDRNNCWRELAGVVTHPDKPNELLFTSDDISTLEAQWRVGSSPAEAMWHHWSTYGREQPDLKDLIRFLRKADLRRAEADVRRDVLRNSYEDDLDNDADSFNSGDINTAVNTIQKKEDHLDIVDRVLTELNLEDLIMFSYQDLQIATQNFCDQCIEAGGCKIGEGAYGTVYKAVITDGVVAVKRLKDPVDTQFITELKILTKYKHENLLPLLGCSLTGPSCCLIYEYMVNGSIQDRLACVGNTDPISWKTRLSIAYNSALGINHLHTFGEKPMVHRDIKSANILLDENFVPKVGDFGLVRIGNSSATTTMAVTENVYGTCVYMAREAFYGDVSVKLDTFSFGVVLLELLTALPPFDSKREDRDLVTHMQNCDNILLKLDPRTDWNSAAAVELHRIAKCCLTESKRERPAISEILKDLKNCLSHIDGS